MKDEKMKVMVAGHICLDITPDFGQHIRGSFEQIFSPGKLINVDQAVIATGGAVSNTGLAMCKLGVDTVLNGKVGEDAFGDMIKKLVGAERAKSLKTVSGQSTSYSVVLSLPGVDRIFLHHTGTNETFGPEDIDEKTLARCALFHFGYPSLMKRMYQNNGSELVEIFSKARSLGVATSLDMALPDPHSDSGRVDWAGILQKTLPYVDLFLPSIEEIAYMIDRELFNLRKSQSHGDDPVLVYSAEDCSRLTDKLITMGVAVIGIKNGIRGCYLKTANADRLSKISILEPSRIDLWANRELWAGSYKADKFGSSTGAGDATIAGFLTAFLKGLNPVESLTVANTVGWQNVRQMDALSGIEDWSTTLKMVQDKNRTRNPLKIEDCGWQFDTNNLVFYGPADSQRK